MQSAVSTFNPASFAFKANTNDLTMSGTRGSSTIALSGTYRDAAFPPFQKLAPLQSFTMAANALMMPTSTRLVSSPVAPAPAADFLPSNDDQFPDYLLAPAEPESQPAARQPSGPAARPYVM